jgi:hypothetical protein
MDVGLATPSESFYSLKGIIIWDCLFLGKMKNTHDKS